MFIDYVLQHTSEFVAIGISLYYQGFVDGIYSKWNERTQICDFNSSMALQYCG
jgi:hypothetical protein